MTHYICTGGCEGVSDKPGTCQAEDCEKHGEPLTKCECTDSNHGDGEDAEEETED
jgi:hypothetical protein